MAIKYQGSRASQTDRTGAEELVEEAAPGGGFNDGSWSSEQAVRRAR